ncbi:spidroin-1-like [Panicum hallii]|uniref:spidroin-1-like n=1 Tax=Panicum hallii TaxID=206008 RepID=UPI000DF4F10A|nr:spidroin-1-like [Panicum hallii]
MDRADSTVTSVMPGRRKLYWDEVIGELVKLYSHGKLRSMWLGLYLVIDTSTHGAITIQDDEGNIHKERERAGIPVGRGAGGGGRRGAAGLAVGARGAAAWDLGDGGGGSQGRGVGPRGQRGRGRDLGGCGGDRHRWAAGRRQGGRGAAPVATAAAAAVAAGRWGGGGLCKQDNQIVGR